jgi:hypothetical protein
MSFPKKKLRTISIDGVNYNWLVGPNDGFNVFVAQEEGTEGRRIEVHFPTEINARWAEYPKTANSNLKIIKPKEAESIIRQAVHQGWNPDEKGNPVKYDLIDDKLVERKKPGSIA